MGISFWASLNYDLDLIWKSHVSRTSTNHSIIMRMHLRDARHSLVIFLILEDYKLLIT